MMQLQSINLDKLIPALLRIQAKIEPIQCDRDVVIGKGGKTAGYASYSKLRNYLIPLLHEEGILFTAFPSVVDGLSCMTPRLSLGDQYMQGQYPIRIDPKSEKSWPMLEGIAQSYALRYIMRNVFLLDIVDDATDNGGETREYKHESPPKNENSNYTPASQQQTVYEGKQFTKSNTGAAPTGSWPAVPEGINEKQHKMLLAKTWGNQAVRDEICNKFGIKKLEHLPWKKMNDAIAYIGSVTVEEA